MRVQIKDPKDFKLVFEKVTGQKLDSSISGITNDSRQIKQGDLYIALKGKHYDGHDFLPSVLESGACVALVSSRNNNINMQQVKVANTLQTLGDIGKEWRSQFDIPVIAITGSNGKTSTKELLIHVLSINNSVHATEGNFNTSIGLPLTLLQLHKHHDVSIIEIGASKVGEIEYLTSIAKPTHGLITNIAPAHLEGFGSIENIAFEKSSLFRALSNGISFINNSDEVISKMDYPGDKITFGFNPDCDFPADIHQEDNGDLTLTMDSYEIPTKSQNLSFLKNSIAVCAISVTLGTKWQNVAKQIQSFDPPPGRCNVKKINNITVIDDTYNANLVSSLAALDYLKAFSGNGRKIFVFGDMFELGSSSEKQHQKIGEKCLELELDIVLTIGDHTIHTKNAIKNRINHFHFKNHDELINHLKNCIYPGDKILFKGSRSMKMETVIDGVFST